MKVEPKCINCRYNLKVNPNLYYCTFFGARDDETGFSRVKREMLNDKKPQCFRGPK